MSAYEANGHMGDAGVDRKHAGHLLTVKFSVPYDTKWGECLILTGSRGLLGGSDLERGIKMQCTHGMKGLVWEASITMPDQYDFEYNYVVVDEHRDREVVAEETEPHSLMLPPTSVGAVIHISDVFKAASNIENVFKTKAFRSVIFGGKAQSSATILQPSEPPAGYVTVRFAINDYTVRNGQSVFVYGNIAELGTWQESMAIRMAEVDSPRWTCDVTIPATSFPVSYRYIVCDTAQTNLLDGDIQEEAGEPRVLCLGSSSDGNAQQPESQNGPLPSIVFQNDGHLQHKTPWRGSGLAVPVFSLRTRDSVGCGEFADIKTMVDFVDACGIRVLQVLPVNDTSVHNMWWDSYPYSSLSVFALHPMYVRLDALAAELPADTLDEIAAARVRATGIDMDYEATVADKLRISRAIYDSGVGERDLGTSAFREWFAGAAEWLQPYAAFCFLRDLVGTSDHTAWGALGGDAARRASELTAPHREWHASIAYTYWLQWHLHLQLLDAAGYAAARRVVLKGDLPIGVDKQSVDTWVHPELFRMDVGIGSPPDAFDPNGQNWGFPGYNWEAMARDGYAWWRRRLAHMAQYFSAFRVDHILGFFRVYEVPARHVTGALGHFRPSRPLWRRGLEAHGLWDLDRLCEPYITRPAVAALLGDLADEAIARYLEPRPGGGDRLAFRPGITGERDIAAIQPRPGSPDWLAQEVETVKRALMTLRQNVILLRDEHDPDKFYPRFELMRTTSFAEFDASKHALLRQLHDGYFYYNQSDIWRDNAFASIPVLMRATDMLMCGEDLGFVPQCVPPVMHELGVIGLRIQRMPGAESPEGAEFAHLSGYSYMTVASPACHDITTTRAWYEEDEVRRERFYYQCLEGVGEVPEKCTPEIMHKVAEQHMMCPSIFCIMPLQDWLALSPRYTGRPSQAETINDPTVKRHYWRYRMHVHLEDLLADEELLAVIQNLHYLSGRGHRTVL